MTFGSGSDAEVKWGGSTRSVAARRVTQTRESPHLFAETGTFVNWEPI